MFAAHSAFGKIVITIGYLLAAFLLVLNVIVVLACLGQVVDGRTFGGVPLKSTDYIGTVLLLLWLWSSLVALIALLQLLRVYGSMMRCRVLAGYLCLLIPFGTIFGVLVFVYLRTQKDWSHARSLEVVHSR